MKILNVQQVRELDAFTIQESGISSIDLMEQAALAFKKWFVSLFPLSKRAVRIFCGPGNNGGDGLAIARLLSQEHYDVFVYILEIGEQKSNDFGINWERLRSARSCPCGLISEGADWPVLGEEDILIDAIFGSGLSRPLKGYWEALVQQLSLHKGPKVSVDIPSGMFADQFTAGQSFQADYTLSFEMPKLSFLMPANDHRVGTWEVRPIGLSKAFILNAGCRYFLLETKEVQKFFKKRTKYSHKGTYGHALMIAGSYGKVGAAVLASKAVLRAGTGLLTIHVPKCAYAILQTSVPEAMVWTDLNERVFTGVNEEITAFASIGIGPGLGTERMTASALEDFLKICEIPLVLDADALNIIAANKDLMAHVPKSSVLTPHPKEFQRLFGPTANDFERLELLSEQAQTLGVYIVLKGAHSIIACPDGTCYFNTSGNPGMATGGSGDVLTGMITGLLAQGYTPLESALMGVYLHGVAGDLAALKHGVVSMIASDIIDHIGAAFKSVQLLNN